MTNDEIKARQQLLRDAGFDVAVDGKDGPSTQQAWERYQLRQAGVDQAKAKADQAKAAAEAERARAEAAAVRAKADLAKQQADAQKRVDEAKERQRAFDRELKDRADKEARQAREGLRKAGINAAALGAGLAGGLLYAKKIDAHRADAVKAAAPKLAQLAKDARSFIKQYEAGKNVPAAAKKLAGVVRAADAAKYTAKAPIGFGPAAVLLAEGAISRFIIAPQFEDETTREAFQALGTTSAVAATTIVGKGAINVKTPTTPVNGRDLAAIETARTVTNAEPKAVKGKARIPRKAAANAASNVSKLRPSLKVAGKVGAVALAGPLFAAITAYDATKSRAMASGSDDGEATAQAAGTAVAVGAGVGVAGYGLGKGIAKGASLLNRAAPMLGKIASKAAAPIVIGMAAYDGLEGYKSEGLKGAFRGVADSLTLGAASVAANMAREILLPDNGMAPPKSPRSGIGRAYLNMAAAKKAQTAQLVSGRFRGSASPTPSGNGWVAGYTRADGVRVDGYRRK